MIEVYYAAPWIYGRKVLAVLEEKNLDYEIKAMSFQAKDHLKEDYLKINPNGEIPAMIDDGLPIYESTAMIEYLNDEYPEPPLMPEDSASRAQVHMIEDYCDLHLYRALVHCAIKKLVNNEELTEEDKKTVAEKVKRIENYLGNKEYMVDTFSLADCAVMPAIATLEGLGFSDLLNASASLKKYVARLKARPGYKGASRVTI